MGTGTLTIVNSLAAHGDAIVPSASTTIKILFYGITANSSNCVLTLTTVVGGAELILASPKSASNDGVIGSILGDSATTTTTNSAMVPLFLDDTLSLRMNGSLASAGDLCSVAYVEVQ
mgnify:FL=1